MIALFVNGRGAGRVRRRHLPCDVYLLDDHTITRRRSKNRPRVGRAEDLTRYGWRVVVAITEAAR